ncbi:hypothetical protein BDW69DRAFT_175646 [Aspergillus filifer]
MELDVHPLPHHGSAQWVIRHGPIICSLASPSEGVDRAPGRAHPCRGAISIWRPVARKTACFKVYPASHQSL